MSLPLTFVSMATCAVSAWMCLMYFVLRHPYYQWRAATAAAIFAGAASLAVGAWRLHPAVRVVLIVWAIALTLLGVWGLRSGDEAWASIAAVLFVAEGAIALVTLSLGHASRRRVGPLHHST